MIYKYLMQGLSHTSQHYCVFKYTASSIQWRTLTISCRKCSENVEAYKSFLTSDEHKGILRQHTENNGPRQKQNISNVSIIARLVSQRKHTNGRTKEREKADIHTFTERLAKVSNAVGETSSALQELKEKEDISLAKDRKYTAANYLENSVEALAFKEDFETVQKITPLSGTENKNIDPSNVPCTGCGAHLQCNSRISPGFMVSEIFTMLSRMELKQSICQRCYYMRHGNAFVEVKVDPKEYEDMVSKIKPTRSMVVMVVDLMDIEGSIVPNLGEIIGHHKPLIVVGNKADLIAPDGPHYLKNIAFELRQACNRAQLHNVKRVELISAKTGFGIEKLISTLFKYYHMEVDVYIVGTANAGKSSLFNILLGSDYCRPAVRDQELIQRATVTEWPGTTLNFLKFPIAKPGKKFSELRNKRLKKYQAQRLEDERLLIEQGKEYETQATWELKEEIKPTDMKLTKILQREMEAKAWGQTAISFTGTPSGKIKTVSQVKDRLAATHFREEMYEKCFWVYDTPGIINPDQVMNQLPPGDNSLVSPPGAVVPRVAMLRPGMTLFVSGLARLDLLECKELVHVTVHASSALPIQVGLTEEADNYYQAKLGTDFLKVPSLYHNQLNKVPALQSVDFEFNGDGVERSAADIQLSSIGFVSVRGHMFTPVRVRAWTPGGVGLSLREPSMLPYIKAYRGSRIHGSYLYETLPQGSALVGKETKNVLDYAARKKREVAISQQKLDKRYST